MKAVVIPMRRSAEAPPAMTDEALVAACATRDPAALAALFDRHHDAVRNFLSRLAGTDETEIEDLTQATFLEVHRSASRFRAEASVRTWIFAIAANLARHHTRSALRRKTLAAALVEVPAPSATGPDVAVEHAQLLQRLSDALHALPHDLRVVFVLCEIEGVSNVEAARVLALREGTVGRRLFDARRKLRRAIEEEQP